MVTSRGSQFFLVLSLECENVFFHTFWIQIAGWRNYYSSFLTFMVLLMSQHGGQETSRRGVTDRLSKWPRNMWVYGDADLTENKSKREHSAGRSAVSMATAQLLSPPKGNEWRMWMLLGWKEADANAWWILTGNRVIKEMPRYEWCGDVMGGGRTLSRWGSAFLLVFRHFVTTDIIISLLQPWFYCLHLLLIDPVLSSHMLQKLTWTLNRWSM